MFIEMKDLSDVNLSDVIFNPKQEKFNEQTEIIPKEELRKQFGLKNTIFSDNTVSSDNIMKPKNRR